MDGSTSWSFEPYETKLFPWIEADKRNTTTQRIDYTGCVSQCLIKTTHPNLNERQMDIVVNNYKSQDPNSVAEQADRGMFSFGVA